MTPQEIREIINKRVKGQGNQVDLDNTIPLIINDILDEIGIMGDLADLKTDHKSTLVEAINELFDVLETEAVVISTAQTNAERKVIYDEIILHPHLAKNVEFFNGEDEYYYRVNGYKIGDGVITFHTLMNGIQGVRSLNIQVASNGTILIA